MARASNTRWWAAEKDQAHEALGTVVRHVHERSMWRRQADELHAELYAGGPGAAGLSLNARLNYDYEPSSLPYNVCRKVVEKALAKVVRHRPLPQALTTRGDWAQQKRARKLTQFIDGEFYRQGIFTKHAKMIVRDALIFGRGILKVFRVGKKIHSERVHPWEVFVDDWDARYGDPQNFYHVRTVDKGVLLARFGKKQEDETDEQHRARVEAIENATVGGGLSEYDWQDEQDATVDRVRIVEAWHLPSDAESDEEADKGRHVVSLLGGNATLVDEEWPYECAPLVVLHYSDAVAGYWGQGLVEQAEGFQYEINDMSQKVSAGHWMLGGGMILVPTGSDIVDTHLNNGTNVPIIKHQPGKPPQFVTPTPIHPASYQRLRDLPMDCESNLGMPQMTDNLRDAAESGMSGVALQALDDVETERFVIFGRDYEEWCRQVAKRFIDLAKEIAKEHGDYAVSVPMKGGLLSLKWADVSLDDVELKVYSGSLLPQQINARLDKLKTLFDAGVVDRATFLRYLDAPDLSAEFDVETAGRLNIDERIEAMLDADDDVEASYRSPSTYSAPGMLEWGRQRAQMRYERAELDGAPEENLELLRRFITESQKLIDLMKPPPAPPGPDLGAGQPVAPPPPGMGQAPLQGAPLAA